MTLYYDFFFIVNEEIRFTGRLQERPCAVLLCPNHVTVGRASNGAANAAPGAANDPPQKLVAPQRRQRKLWGITKAGVRACPRSGATSLPQSKKTERKEEFRGDVRRLRYILWRCTSYVYQRISGENCRFTPAGRSRRGR